MNFCGVIVLAVPIGIVATLVMDVIGWTQKRVLGVPPLDYAFVGRWVMAMREGRFRHQMIMQSPRQQFERPVGWVLHYLIGIAFVALMLGVTGPGWAERPTIWAPMITGLLSVAAPFLIMQPAFGFGFAASRTPMPWTARRRSLVAHLSFGIGIYLAGLGLSLT